MIDLKNNLSDNVEKTANYFSDNKEIILDEISTLKYYEFYEKHLIHLKPRQFLSFIFMVVDEITDSRLKNVNESVKLIEHMVGEECFKMTMTTLGEVYLMQPSFGSINTVHKRTELLRIIHNVNNEMNTITEIIKNPFPEKTSKKRL